MIHRILINNFQKHDSLELEFSKGLNVISGQSDVGKTCIFRALSWLCGFSNVSEIDYRKEGTDKTSVKVWLDNGFQVERIRTDTINRYILFKEGCEDKTFDSFGRQAPEEIQQVLGLKEINIEDKNINLNFASQDQLNFILDSNYSDTFKAKLFNKLTGNEIIDALFKDLNKESLSVSRGIKDTEEHLAKQEDDLANYSLTYKTLNSKLCMVNEIYNKLQEDIKIYEELKSLADKLKVNKESQDFVRFKISKIKIVSDEKIQDLKKQAEQINYVLELINKSTAIHNKLKDIEEQKKKLKISNANFEELKKQAIQLTQLQDIAKKISDITTKNQVLDKEMRRITDLISEGEADLKKAWELCGNICPLCKQEKPNV